MNLNIEFICGLDNVDTEDLVIDNDNITDYSCFEIIFKNNFCQTRYFGDSSLVSSDEIMSFINNLTYYENDTSCQLFFISEDCPVFMKDKTLTFSVSNYKYGFKNVSFSIRLNSENLQDILNVFNRLLEFKIKLEDLYEDPYENTPSDIGEETDSSFTNGVVSSVM